MELKGGACSSEVGKAPKKAGSDNGGVMGGCIQPFCSGSMETLPNPLRKQQGEFGCLVKVLSIQHRDTAEAGHPEMWCAFAATSWQKAGACNPPQRPFCGLKQNTQGQTGRWPQLLHHFARNCNGAVDVCLSVCQ